MGLREKLTGTQALRAWEGTIPVAFRYTAGAAGQRFFEVLRSRDRFAVTRCPECAVTYLPPRLYCRDCFKDLSGEWQEVAPRGVVHTFTVVRHDQDGAPLPRPQVIAFVAIDGTDGGLLVPLDLEPGEVLIGRPVEAVLRPVRQRRGALDDILHFR